MAKSYQETYNMGDQVALRRVHNSPIGKIVHITTAVTMNGKVLISPLYVVRWSDDPEDVSGELPAYQLIPA